MLNVNQMIMKKVLNITEHKDGSYSLNHLSREEMHAIQSALINNWLYLEEKQLGGLELSDVAAYNLTFADEASDQLSDLGF